MGFVRDLLVFFHLLGMAALIGTFLLQLRAVADSRLSVGWLHGLGLQLVTGVLLIALAGSTHAHYNNVKLGFKMLVLVIIGVLAIVFRLRRQPAQRWQTFTLGGLDVLNVGIAVFWS